LELSVNLTRKSRTYIEERRGGGGGARPKNEEVSSISLRRGKQIVFAKTTESGVRKGDGLRDGKKGRVGGIPGR